MHAVVINATERLYQTVITYDGAGNAIESQSIYKTFNDETGEVTATRSAPVIRKGADLDATKMISEIPAFEDIKKDADDAAKAAAEAAEAAKP